MIVLINRWCGRTLDPLGADRTVRGVNVILLPRDLVIAQDDADETPIFLGD